ncbi:DUF4185 domain-containing protein [Mumia sp. ZJ1417]|uniref:DUF4185 domain-containing protein n=1 Tax=Mumia sp. ZJ1417 TaxID=2708082 RepID=UPI00141D8C76|nr:DUF4185 domain-containing protein [Mumia sp. ZJ1417]QMW66473.1 DUF4185 domain-containing protein [Mumia sp. ZJ1417]
MDDSETTPRRARRRWIPAVAAVVLACLAIVAVLLVRGPLADADDDKAGDASLATKEPMASYASPCVSIPRLRSITDLQSIVDTTRGGAALQGADVGADLTLQDGRRIWVMGDTLRAADFDGQRFVRNSMLLISDGCAQTVLPEDNGALIPDRADGVGYWPMSIGRVHRNGVDVVGVGVQRVRGTGGASSTDFENLGPAIAVFHVEPGGVPQLVEVKDIGRDDPSRKRPTWGAAVAIKGEWVYLYGTANPEVDGVFGYSLRVARVHIDHLRDHSRWRYWDGTEWSKNAAEAVELIPAQGGVSQTLSVFEQDGSWYAVSKQDEFLGQDLVIWKAPAPSGPFTRASTVARIPSNAVTGQLRYMPLAHPAILPVPGTVIVSYSRNNTDLGKVEANPFLYRPAFIRVRLP